MRLRAVPTRQAVAVYTVIDGTLPDRNSFVACLSTGFYVASSRFPSPHILQTQTGVKDVPDRLLLGPFCGKPACQFIDIAPGNARGVCADAYIARRTLLVEDVDAYPGHIACDGETKSEIVCPLVVRTQSGEEAVGVLDLDCLVLGGFTLDDQKGLERIAQLVTAACDW